MRTWVSSQHQRKSKASAWQQGAIAPAPGTGMGRCQHPLARQSRWKQWALVLLRDCQTTKQKTQKPRCRAIEKGNWSWLWPPHAQVTALTPMCVHITHILVFYHTRVKCTFHAIAHKGLTSLSPQPSHWLVSSVVVLSLKLIRNITVSELCMLVLSQWYSFTRNVHVLN